MSCDRRSTAFSLIELVVVLVIISLLVSLAGLTLRTHFEQASLMKAYATASQADHFCRQLAQRSPGGTVELAFDAKHNRLVARPAGRSFALHSSVRLASVTKHSSGQWTAADRIQFSTPGVSPSYSLCFEQGDSMVWVGFLGLSGQDTVVRDEQELREIFP